MSSTLACSYLKTSLRSPVIVGACPLTMEPEFVRQAIDCGAGAVVFPSIFQEQVESRDQLPSGATFTSAPNSDALHQEQYNGGPDRYLANLQEIKRLSAVPVIASMNGCSDGRWLDFAKHIQASGADALELNIQPLVTNPLQTSEEIETLLCETVRGVCERVTIPVAVKLSPHFTNVANIVHRLQLVGADGVVLFAHEAKWDVAVDRLRWTIHWELTPVESVATTVAGIIRARVGTPDLSIAASGGVRTAEDAIKVMIAGADVVMVTSEVYRSGPEAIRKIVHGLERYLESGGFESLPQFQQARPAPETRCRQFRRLSYLDPLTRSAEYRDPTPVVQQQTGDRYGHRD